MISFESHFAQVAERFLARDGWLSWYWLQVSGLSPGNFLSMFAPYDRSLRVHSGQELSAISCLLAGTILIAPNLLEIRRIPTSLLVG